MLLEFGEYLPDLAPIGNPGSPDMINVLPTGGGYEPFPRPVIFSSAITNRPQGGFACRDADGTVFNFAGSSTKLHHLTGTTWDDVTRTSGGAYTTGSDERWSFVQFGRRVIATNYTDAMQAYLMGTDTDFSALTGSPPKARYITAVKDFVVVGNTSDGSFGAVPHRVQWSSLSDPTASWATSAATQADYQDLDASRGFIRQVVGGEYGIIFQERAITRMTYVGSPLVFQFDEIEVERGTQAPGSVVKVGNLIFYLGTDLRFYLFDGNRSLPIGDNKVNNTFKNDLNVNFLHRISACADPNKPIIYLSYPSTSNSGGSPDKILAYNYSLNRFAPLKFNYTPVPFALDGMENLFVTYAAGYTLDGLDAVSTSIDSLAYSLDSTLWTGGAAQLSAFRQNGDYKLVLFSDNVIPYDGFIETPEAQLFSGQKAQLLEFRPIIEHGLNTTVSVTASVYYRDNALLSSGYNSVQGYTPTTNGYVPTRVTAMYHKIRLNVSGLFKRIQGIEITKATPVGHR